MGELESTDNKPAEVQNMIESIIPYMDGGTDTGAKKAKYLGYRACNFGVLESCELAGFTKRTLDNYRADDKKFVELEDSLPQFRKDLRHDILNMEFARNFRMVLENDFRIFKKFKDTPDKLTEDEHKYLIKARSHYTPQQLEILESMKAGEGTGNPLTFIQIVMNRAKRKDSDNQDVIEGECHEVCP